MRSFPAWGVACALLIVPQYFGKCNSFGYWREISSKICTYFPGVWVGFLTQFLGTKSYIYTSVQVRRMATIYYYIGIWQIGLFCQTCSFMQACIFSVTFTFSLYILSETLYVWNSWKTLILVTLLCGTV
jgi:hypothetical protein